MKDKQRVFEKRSEESRDRYILKLTGTVSKLETHMTPVKLVDGYRQSHGFRPRRTIVMVYYQTLIFRATVHSCGPKQTLFQRLTVRIQD